MATSHPTVSVDSPSVRPEEPPAVGIDHVTVVPANYDSDD